MRWEHFSLRESLNTTASMHGVSFQRGLKLLTFGCAYEAEEGLR